MFGGYLRAPSRSIFVLGLSFFLGSAIWANQALATDSQLTSLSAAAGNSEPSASTSYTLTLVTNTSLASGTVVMMGLDADLGTVNLSSVTGSSITSTMSGSGSTETFSEQTYLKYTLNSAATAGTYTITIANLTNPSTSDSVTVTLTTQGMSGFFAGNTATATITIGSGTGGGDGDGGDGGFGGSTGDNTISVTVLDEDGNPLNSQIVSGWCGMSFGQASTTLAGTASIEELTNGNCGVQLNTSGGYYADIVYFTFLDSDEAQSEDVSLTATALDTSISITVTDSNGDPAYPAYLSLIDETGRTFSASTDESGVAEISADYGTYNFSGYFDSTTDYFPDQSITITSDSATQTTSIQLEAYNSFISGTVTNANDETLSEPRMLVISDGGDIRFFTGEEDGTYAIGVEAGTYTIKAESTGYANGAVRNITVRANQTKSGKDISLEVAENTLNVSIVDEDGVPNTDISGGVMCKDPDGFDPVSVYFGFMSSGAVSFILPDGSFQCSLFTSGYATNSPTFTLADGETEAGEITIINYDATLVVNLVDQDGNAVNDVRYGVFGQNNTGTKTLNGFSMGGQTSIGAAAATYTLRVYTMSGEYMTDFTDPTVVTLTADGTETVDLVVYEKTGTLSGTITDTNGDPVSEAAVTATSTKSAKPFSFSTVTDENGDYSMSVVPSTYEVSAAKEGSDDLPTTPQTIQVGDGADKTLNDSLENTNATMTVTPLESVEGDIESGSCYAFEPEGTYVNADLDGDSAQLAVNPGEWHYGCRVIIGSKEYVTRSEGVATLAKNDSIEVESEVLSGGIAFSNVVYQFSATADSTLILPDDTKIFVPANTLDTTGNVSIIASSAADVGVTEDDFSILPINLEARDSNGQLIEGTFNGQVTITFFYTAKKLNQNGIDEDDLEGQSFKNDAWSTTDQGFTVKRGADYVSISTDHFSTFGLVAPIHIPNKVRALTTGQLTKTTAKFTWTKPRTSKVETYTVQSRKFGNINRDSWTTTQDMTGTQSTLRNLNNGTRYQVRVKACNAQGCGDFTDWKAFTTKDATGA